MKSIVIVSPFPQQYVPDAVSWIRQHADMMLDDSDGKELLSLPSNEAACARLIEALDGSRTFGILLDGNPVGLFWFVPIAGMESLQCGHLVFERSERVSVADKLKAGRRVMEMLAQDGVERVQFGTFPDNKAFQAYIRRLGGERTATYQNAALRNGKPSDLISLAINLEAQYVS